MSGTGTHRPSASVVKSRSFAEELKMSRLLDDGCSMLAVEGRPVNSMDNELSSKVSYFITNSLNIVYKGKIVLNTICYLFIQLESSVCNI